MIRKVYWDLIKGKIRQGRVGWVARRGAQYLLLHLSDLLRRPMCGPALGTLMVTYRCNFHCSMCDMPSKGAKQARAGVPEFDTAQFMAVIEEFSRLGVPGIGFTGGEPLLRQDIFQLLAATRKQGMISHLNTNGWFLDDEAAEKIIQSGADSINISLDGACAATHDRIRNHPGSFERATTAVGRLNRLRRKTDASLRIKTVAVIDETNLGEVPEMLRLGRELGTDCMELIPRQPFLETDGSAPAPAEPTLLARVDRLVEYLMHETTIGTRIENSPGHLRLFRDSFAGRPNPVRCRAGYNSLAVDCYGNIFPCVPWINWGQATGHLEGGTLAEIWRSEAYGEQRARTATCRNCYLNCQTELNLLFSRGKRFR